MDSVTHWVTFLAALSPGWLGGARLCCRLVVPPDCALCTTPLCFYGVEPGPCQGDRKVEGAENCPPGQVEIAK